MKPLRTAPLMKSMRRLSRSDILSLEPQMPTPDPTPMPLSQTFVAVLPGHVQEGMGLSGYAFETQALVLDQVVNDDWELSVVSYEPEELVDTQKQIWIDGSLHDVYLARVKTP